MRNKRLVLILALSLAACGTGQKTEPRVLRILNWTDYIGDSTVASFEEKYHVRVSYDNYSSNEELIAKLAAGGAGYDLVFPSEYAVEILHAKGLLAHVQKDSIPNLRYLMKEFSSPETDPHLDFGIPYTWSTTALAYDARAVIANDTDSWGILFSKKYDGKIMLLDDMRATIGMALKSLGYSANTTDSAQIDEAGRKLLDSKDLIHVFASSNLPDLISRGEVSVAYAWSGDILQATAKNPDYKFSIPTEGTLMYVDYMCVPKSATSPDLAFKFINHILDPDVSLEIARTIKYATTNAAARDKADAQLRSLWEVLQLSKSANTFENVRNVGEALRFYDRAWTLIKTSR